MIVTEWQVSWNSWLSQAICALKLSGSDYMALWQIFQTKETIKTNLEQWMDRWVGEFWVLGHFCASTLRQETRGITKGGMVVRTLSPHHWPQCFVIFTKSLAKWPSGEYPRRFCTLKTPSLFHFWQLCECKYERVLRLLSLHISAQPMVHILHPWQACSSMGLLNSPQEVYAIQSGSH